MTVHTSLNARIVHWLRQRPLDTRHGNGECWSLAEDALRAVNARTSRQLTPRFSTRADYVWGDEESTFAAIVPGDVLQLRDYRVRTTTTTVDFLTGPLGRADEQTLERPHHTAIALNVVMPGLLLDVIEQNVPRPGSARADRVVQINRFALASCRGPSETRVDGLGERQTVTTSYTILGGRIGAFHPQPR